VTLVSNLGLITKDASPSCSTDQSANRAGCYEVAAGGLRKARPGQAGRGCAFTYLLGATVPNTASSSTSCRPLGP
jgi:hypothetical protein